MKKIEIISKETDAYILAKALKNQLKEMTIKPYTIDDALICSYKFPDGELVDFNIKYIKNELLSVNVGNIFLTSSYHKKQEVVSTIYIKLLDILKIEPTAFYTKEEEIYYIPYVDWVFKDKENYMNKLEQLHQDKKIGHLAIFDDENKNKSKIKR